MSELQVVVPNAIDVRALAKQETLRKVVECINIRARQGYMITILSPCAELVLADLVNKGYRVRRAEQTERVGGMRADPGEYIVEW